MTQTHFYVKPPFRVNFSQKVTVPPSRFLLGVKIGNRKRGTRGMRGKT